ncbi:5-formyltetrahydrofolate cyclo-ligase [Streptomyces jumonjinensis]|uniref:5-formyltetrahydrofolate cyclo-ligase n=1 Tax=Streptomyces jumonjinensis TaxID=1945 RepID=UPI0037B0C502
MGPRFDTKQEVRNEVWNLLDSRQAVNDPSAHGRIPDFKGTEAASALLSSLPEWQSAAVVKAVPDRAQLPVRVAALEARKTVYMAVPKLATPKPFYLLDPALLTGHPLDVAATGKGAAGHAPTVEVDAMAPIDLIVLGSVAVNRTGVRIGKGAGYSDIEFGLLVEAGLVTDRTLIVTTVHSLQVIDRPIPTAEHDVRVDVIVTPEEVIRCVVDSRPRGIYWKSLDPEKIAAIPALGARQGKTVDSSS